MAQHGALSQATKGIIKVIYRMLRSFLHGRDDLRWTSGFVGLLAACALAFVMTLTTTAPALAAPYLPAHARYLSSDPAANATLKVAPSVVTVHFAEAVDPAGSAITIYDAKGQVVSQAAQVDTADLKTMRVPMQGDGSEVYLVVWHTISAADGDPDVGAFSFFVNKSGASELAPTTTTPQATTTAAHDAGTPIWLTALLVALGALLGAGGGVMWARRGGAGAR